MEEERDILRERERGHVAVPNGLRRRLVERLSGLESKCHGDLERGKEEDRGVISYGRVY